jgi:dCTP deaminase
MFLSDAQLQQRLTESPELFDGLKWEPDDWSESAAVQPASVDLTIGNIYVPGTEDDKPGSPSRPRDAWSLDAGQTAVVTTAEVCNLPAELGAFGFPPSSVSSKGLLMTNPGHVDPGYSGTMSFTVINMGQERFVLHRGDPIVTLLVFELAAPAHCDWRTRNAALPPRKPGAVSVDTLDGLSSDFLDISRRVHKAASSEELKTRRWSIVAPIAVTAISAFVLAWTTQQSQNDEVDRLRERTATLESRLDALRLDQRVKALEARSK